MLTPIINRTEITKPAKLDLGLTLSRSDRPSQQELGSVSPKYTLPQQPLNATGPLTSINAHDSKDCCKSDTPMLAVDSQEKYTQAAEKSSETTVYTAVPDAVMKTSIDFCRGHNVSLDLVALDPDQIKKGEEIFWHVNLSIMIGKESFV
ncbi:hypothetical protein ElyMa_002888400 [Elysia marginata]|uniref:Uncharacterized protein n=1 Tax=Elysia marginata TaxID=1093978 RepID=A0AAV4HZN5_9GAST|nr:hypothetical protein ElyMa_002888400 [Elysia marginata]